MAYGILKCDTVTFTDGGVDKSVSISGLVQNPTFSGNITVTGTVSGNAIQGQTVSGVTVTGTTALFSTGTFISLTGTTSQGTTATYTSGSFTFLTGVTTSGTTANFVSGVFSTQISGATVTGNAGAFTTLTGGVTTITSGVFAAGSATNPSISFSSDTNTGIYSPGADQVAISTSGSGRLFVDASGNISAGNSTAFGPLDIKTSAGKRIVYTSLADYASNGIIGLTDGGNETDLGIGGNNLRFFTAAIERLRITSAGLVGVGTSSPDANSQLHIVGSSYQPLYVNTTGVGGGGATFFRSGTQALYVGTAGSSWLSGSSTADGLVRAEANLVLATNGNSRAVTIDTSQRVGIGTSAPQSAVDVLSGVRGVPETSGSTTSVTTLRLRGSSNGVLDIGELSSATAGSYWLQVRDRTDLGFAYNLALQPNGGNVGIGTTSPNSVLQVNSGTNLGGILVGFNSGSSNFYDADLQVFRTGNGTERARIDSSGRVGIGTTSPQELLHVNTGSSGGQVLRLSTNGADTGYLYQNSGAVVLGAYSTRILGFETNGTERARIDSSGRLLVGTSTTSESTTMVVQGRPGDANGAGTIFLQGNYSGDAGALYGEISFKSAEGILARISGVGDLNHSGDAPGRLVFSTTADGASSPTERMRINKNGEILFGTSTTTNGCKLALVNTDATRKWGFGTIGTNTYFAVVDDTSGAGVQLNAGSTSWSTFSDERLKDNLAPIQDGLDKVSQLRAVTGRYKTDDINVSRSFLIAQDVQAVLPEAVDIMSDDMRTLSLKYTEVIPLLVSALKESKERIETLEAKVVALESA